MNSLPLISIAVPSYNQAPFIRETLQSLVDQQYPNLEVIIQDGCSTDGSASIAREFTERHPSIFRLFVEKDKGFAQALNRAFHRCNGEILAYLNTDDTLYPGCLHRVAAEIDPDRDRFIVFGRCLFTGENSPYVGVEHPSEFVDHFHQLAIWKRGYNTLPQPSVFWHRRVWEKHGGVKEEENHLVDYDLFCRYSKTFHFHRVDELWSTYRMHPSSKSSNITESELLARSIQRSRAYWGPWWTPLRWRCEISHWIHSQQFHERARHHARRAEQAWDSGKCGRAVGEAMHTLRYSPSMAWHRLIQPLLSENGLAGLVFLVFKDEDSAAAEFVGKHGDNWIGPVYRHRVEFPHDHAEIQLLLQHIPQPGMHHQNIEVDLLVNGRKLCSERRTEKGQFAVRAMVKRPPNQNSLEIELRTRPYFVPRLVSGSPDDRKLCLLLLDTVIRPCNPGPPTAAAKASGAVTE